jgi:starch synthase
MIDIDADALHSLKSADLQGFLKIGIQYSDVIIKADEQTNAGLEEIFNEINAGGKKFDTIEKDDKFLDSYYNLYNELAG